MAAITVGLTYFAPSALASAWYVLMLIGYLRSGDEPFWLALFFITTDGFFGFLGLYSTLLKVIPGMPGVELAQLYAILALAKCFYRKESIQVFYGGWLKILLGYAIFLVVLGFLMGFPHQSNAYFKVIKWLLPLTLFYSVPRLLRTDDDYASLFQYIFLTLALAFAAQLVTLFTGFDPKLAYGAKAETEMEMNIEVGRNFRVLYNSSITIIGLFGALYYLALGKASRFSRVYLYLVVVMAFCLAFLSATRGWILSFGLIITLFFIFVQRLRLGQLLMISVLFIGAASLGLSNKKISRQIDFSLDRLFTLNSLASGDITADGTLVRLNERGPRVMKVWRESPVFGQGFSERFLAYEDGHVANQNILMQAGVTGLVLMLLFFGYFSYRILQEFTGRKFNTAYSFCLPVFLIFLPGWYLLHSTSGQQFAFYGLPGDIFPQAIFFSMGAFTLAAHRSEARSGSMAAVDQPFLLN